MLRARAMDVEPGEPDSEARARRTSSTSRRSLRRRSAAPAATAERARDGRGARAASAGGLGRVPTEAERAAAAERPGAEAQRTAAEERRRRRRRRRIGSEKRAGAGVAKCIQQRVSLLLRPDGGDGGAAVVDGDSGSGLCLLLCPARAARREVAPAGARRRPTAVRRSRDRSVRPRRRRARTRGSLDAPRLRRWPRRHSRPPPLFERRPAAELAPRNHWRLRTQIARSRSTVGDATRSTTFACDPPRLPTRRRRRSPSRSTPSTLGDRSPFAYHPPPAVSALLPPGGRPTAARSFSPSLGAAASAGAEPVSPTCTGRRFALVMAGVLGRHCQTSLDHAVRCI